MSRVHTTESNRPSVRMSYEYVGFDTTTSKVAYVYMGCRIDHPYVYTWVAAGL